MPSQSSGDSLTIQRVTPREAGRLALASGALDTDGRIDGVYSGYGDDRSPPLEWTAIPEAESFAIVVEDPDAPMEHPVVHWIAWNIPGSFDGIPAGIRPAPILDELGGLVQGLNSHGKPGYMGPKPPADHGPHHYHFQLFALDRRLDLPPSTPLAELVGVLKGCAIASGELVGTYACARDLQPPEGRSFAGREDRGGLDADDVDRHAPHDADGVVRPRA